MAVLTIGTMHPLLAIACFWHLGAASPGGERPFFRAALAAAELLEKSAVCTNTSSGRACHWMMNSTDDAPKNHPYLANSLYYGSPGLAIFFMQAADADHQGRSRWESASAAAVQDIRQGSQSSISKYGANAGFYYGLSGLAFGIRASGKAGLEASEIEEYILTQVAPFSAASDAVLWNNTDVAHGAAGTGLYLLWAARKASGSSARALFAGALRAGKWLLQRAEAASATQGGGLRWARGPDTDGDHGGLYFPTFCCGAAGVGYFLATLGLAMDEFGLAADEGSQLREDLLSAARKAGEHVLGLAVAPEPGMLLLPHGEAPPDTSFYYLGWCGGAPGWARLFVKLWETTGEDRWLRSLEDAATGLISSVLPNISMMLPVGTAAWQNLGQCCGAAGAGTFLLSMASSNLPLRGVIRAAAMTAAEDIGAAIVAHAVEFDGGIAFPSPEEHALPFEKRWQAGWMQGAAGMASFLLHLDAVKRGSCAGARQPWPDEPWSCVYHESIVT